MKTKNLKKLNELLQKEKIDYLKSIIAIVMTKNIPTYDNIEETVEVPLYDIYESIFDKNVEHASGGAIEYYGIDYEKISLSDILIMVNRNTSKIIRYLPDIDSNKLVDLSVSIENEDEEDTTCDVEVTTLLTDDDDLNDIIIEIRSHLLDIFKNVGEMIRAFNAEKIIRSYSNLLYRMTYDVFIKSSDELTDDLLDELQDCMDYTVIYLEKQIMPDVKISTVSTKKAAEILGCNIKEMRAIIKAGMVDAFKSKGHWVINLVSLLKFKYGMGGNK